MNELHRIYIAYNTNEVHEIVDDAVCAHNCELFDFNYADAAEWYRDEAGKMGSSAREKTLSLVEILEAAEKRLARFK